MNKKAEIFSAMLEEEKITVFQTEEVNDEFHAVVYRSNISVKKQMLPTLVLIDDSIYTMVRVVVAPGVVNDDNRSQVEACINKLNLEFKVFKYYVTEGGDIILDCCLPSSDEHFDGNLIRAILDVIVRHLEERYADIMKVVWAED